MADLNQHNSNLRAEDLAEKLNNSIILDVHKFSEFKAVNQAKGFLHTIINEDKDESTSIAKRHIKTVLINLYNPFLTDASSYLFIAGIITTT